MLLFSLNIEGSRHLDKWLPFVRSISPDVVCLQEVLRKDLPKIRQELSADCEFVAQQRLTGCLADHLGGPGELGIALLSPHGLSKIEVDYYRKRSERIIPSTNVEDAHRAFLSAEIATRNGPIRVGTVHFTWSNQGVNSVEQAQDLNELLQITARHPDLIFAGDFNIPRATSLFSRITESYCSWIPEHYDSSLDENLFRRKNVRLVVDHLFSTSSLKAFNVRYCDGLSDHKAIMAQISRVEPYRRSVAA